MKVYRYNIGVDSYWAHHEKVFDMPLGAEVLSVAPARAGYGIDLWAKVPEESPMVPYRFEIHGTGHSFTHLDGMQFVGTCVMADGLVWHAFLDTDAPARLGTALKPGSDRGH